MTLPVSIPPYLGSLAQISDPATRDCFRELMRWLQNLQTSTSTQVNKAFPQDIRQVTSFLNGWGNKGAPYDSVSYHRHNDDHVDFEGVLSAGAVNSPAFTLDAGFRPPVTRLHACASNGAFGIIKIESNGDVTPISPCNNTYVSLDGVVMHV